MVFLVIISLGVLSPSVVQYTSNIEQLRKRMIIFVCHSMGGIVMKKVIDARSF